MANANYEAERARARAAGDWNGVVDATPAMTHIKKLARAGVGYRMIAEVARISTSVVRGIKKGTRKQARARTIRKILAVTTKQRGDVTHVNAKSTWVLINRLLEEGYTKTYLARQMGCTRALQLNKHRVTAKNAAKVERLYKRLMT